VLSAGSHQQCASQAQLELARRLAPGAELKAVNATKLALAKDQFCAAAFEANEGTCCDYESLKTFADKLIATLKQQLGGIDGIIATFPTILDALPKLLEHLQLKDPVSNSDPDFIKAIGGEKYYYSYQAILQHLTTQSKTISEDITTKKYDAVGCLKSIFTQKLSSLCLVCSANAGKYFNENTRKFLFKKAGIQAIVTSCCATFDIFNKVAHGLQAFRVINQALSSKDAIATVPPADFSLDKMLKYEECKKNPEQYSSDNTKLLAMGSELGGATKPPAVATRATENIAAVPGLKEAAADGFKKTIDQERVKLEGVKTERLAQANLLNPATAGSPPKVLAEQVIEIGNLETERTTKYVPALTILANSSSTSVQRAAAEQDLLNYAKLAKKSIEIYTKLGGVIEKFVNASKDELTRTNNATRANELMANQQDGLGLAEKLKQAINASTLLDAVAATVETAQKPLAQDLNDKYRKLLQIKAANDIDVQSTLGTLKPSIDALFAAVEARIKNEAAVADRNMQLSTNRALAVDKQKVVDGLKPPLDAAANLLEVAKSRVRVLTSIKTQLSGTLPVATELNNTANEYLARSTALKQIIADGQKVKDAVANWTSSGLPPTVPPFNTYLQGELQKINASIVRINTKLSGTDATSVNMTAAITTANASIESLKADIAAQEANITAKQADIATLKNSLPPLQTDLFAKAAALKESLGVISLQLAKIADYKGKMKSLDADYAAKSAALTGEKDSIAKLQLEKCPTTSTPVNQTYCDGLAAKVKELDTAIGGLPALKQTAISPLQQEVTKLETDLAALRTALAPVQAAHDAALAKVKEVDTAIRAAVDAINTAYIVIGDKRRLIIAKETERQVQTNSTSSFNTEIKAKVDEELKIQKTELEAILPLIKNLSVIVSASVTRNSTADIKGKLTEYDATVSSLKLADTSLTSKSIAFSLLKTAIEQKIQAQLTQVSTDVTKATTDQTAAQTAYDAAKTAFDAAKAQLDNLMQVPAPLANLGRRLRRVLEIAEQDVDIEFSETSGADTTSQFSPGVEVDTNLASTSTFSGAKDPTKLETPAPAAGSISYIRTLCSLAIMTSISILI
jgi:uncharacterized protein YqgV (UPF0045/DUF77 family)